VASHPTTESSSHLADGSLHKHCSNNFTSLTHQLRFILAVHLLPCLC